MNWFAHLNTRAKLLVCFGLMLLLLLLVAVAGNRGVVSLSQAQSEARQSSRTAAELLRLQASQNDNRLATLMVLNAPDAVVQAQWSGVLAENSRTNTLLLQSIQADAESASFRSRLDEYVRVRMEFGRVRDTQVLALARQGNIEEARALSLGEQNQRFMQMRAIVQEMVELSEKGMEDAHARSYKTAADVRRTLLVTSLVAVPVALSLVLLLSSLVSNPLRDLSAVSERVVAGDLTAEPPALARRDEVGVLCESFRRMLKNLRDVNREISSGVNVLASSASQILAATTEIASSAAETATAVSQTTATVEQVKQTAEVSKQKSRNVAEVAQRAVRASHSGRKSVDESIEGMNRVRDQMESIAESIVRLSEQGQAIGEIIATVNELAEQSNLLAVNAAIEAAKAGEHGRGFAVVAQEVKSLAAQSKQATAQVRGILSDIQKATSSAVMATEQGSKAVEAGVQQSSRAGESIRLLGENINEASQAASQITASSEQQFVGMDQVAMAMENIKQAAHQNVNGTRQAEAGARNLHELGQKLRQLVEQFKT